MCVVCMYLERCECIFIQFPWSKRAERVSACACMYQELGLFLNSVAWILGRVYLHVSACIKG